MYGGALPVAYTGGCVFYTHTCAHLGNASSQHDNSEILMLQMGYLYIYCE